MADTHAKDELDIARNLGNELRDILSIKQDMADAELKGLDIQQKVLDELQIRGEITAEYFTAQKNILSEHKKILEEIKSTGKYLDPTVDAYKEAALVLKNINREENRNINQKEKLWSLAQKIGGKFGIGGIVDLTKKWGEEYGKILVSIDVSLSIFKAIFGVFKELDLAAWEFRKAMGTTRSETAGITANANEIAIQFANIGLTATNFYNSLKAVGETIGTTQFTTKAMATDMSIMAAQVGVAEKTSAEFLKTMGMMGRSTMDAQKGMLFFVQRMSEAAGTNLNEVMNDIATATKASYQYLTRSPLALAKAAVEARRMGTSLSDATKSSSSLLKFGESVNAEMEASVLLGKSINLQRARELAYRKDVRGLNEEILKIAEDTRFETLDNFQQEAIAKALGKSADEVGKMLQSAREQREIERAINADPKLKEKKKLLDDMAKATAEQAKNYAKMASDSLSLTANQNAVARISQSWHKIIMTISEFWLPKIAGILDVVVSIMDKMSGSWTAFIVGTVGAIAGIFGVIAGVKKLTGLFSIMGTAASGGAGAGGAGGTTGGMFGWIEAGFRSLNRAAQSARLISDKIYKISVNVSKSIIEMGRGIGRGIGSAIRETLKGISRGIASFGKPDVVKGIGAIVLLSLALIPFAFSMKLMEGVNWKTVGVMSVGLFLLVGAVKALGVIMSSGVGTVAILAGSAALLIIGTAMIPFAYAATLAAKALQNLAGVEWKNIAGGLSILGLASPLIAAFGASALFAAPGIGLFALALWPLSKVAKEIGVSMVNMGNGFKIMADSIERLENINLTDTIFQIKSLSSAIIGVSNALNVMPNVQVDKIERMQLKGISGGENPTAVVKDTSLLDEVKGMRSEIQKLREDFSNGKLQASVSLDAQKLDSFAGRSLEFRGKYA